jgi:hypothetical protein
MGEAKEAQGHDVEVHPEESSGWHEAGFLRAGRRIRSSHVASTGNADDRIFLYWYEAD